jgi:copper chaperone
MATATLKVTGMSCEHCVRAVTNALKESDGVRDARVDLKAGKAVVDYDETMTTPRTLANAVMDEGYSAEEMV